MATWWKTDGTFGIATPKSADGVFTLKEMQEAVGGYIELVRLDAETFMIVNEEGKLKGLAFNLKGTELYRQMAEKNGYVTFEPIVGDILVCSRKEAGEES